MGFRVVLGLAAVLALAATLRVACLYWGLPLPIPEVAASDLRNTYSFDEDNIVGSVVLNNPRTLDLDPRRYFYGMLHYHLTLVWLETADLAGLFPSGWRTAYRQMTPGAFERVYAVGRSLSLGAGLLSVVLIYWLGSIHSGRETGLWAALFAAVAPVHLLASTQVRADITAMLFLTLAAALAMRAQQDARPLALLGTGFAAGLAVAAKHPAIFVAYPVALFAACRAKFAIKLCAIVTAGFGLGVVCGEPFLLLRHTAAIAEVRKVAADFATVPAQLKLPIAGLLARDGADLARFGIGLTVAALAGLGVVAMCRRRSPRDLLFLAGIVGVVASLVVLLWPLLRYQLLLVPFLAVAAATTVAGIPGRIRYLAGALAGLVPLFASVSQVHYMLAPHPSNEMMLALVRTVPRGTPVARLMPKIMPLSLEIYPLGPNPFLDDLRTRPPAWVVMSDLPEGKHPASNLQLLADRYAEVARFRLPRVFSWATLGETGAPHDWKYTHPDMTLYRLRQP